MINPTEPLREILPRSTKSVIVYLLHERGGAAKVGGCGNSSLCSSPPFEPLSGKGGCNGLRPQLVEYLRGYDHYATCILFPDTSLMAGSGLRSGAPLVSL